MKIAFWAISVLGVFAGAVGFSEETIEAVGRHERRHAKGVNKAVVGICEKISGASYIFRASKSGRSGVILGDALFERDRVQTDRSRLHVRFKDGTYVELGDASSFEVERVRFKAPNVLPSHKAADQFDESVFRFLYGVARITAPDVHSLEHFTVKTANALVRVTGPADFFLVQLIDARDLAIRVVRGKVDLMNAVTNEHIEVPEGTGAFLKVTGAVTSGGPFSSDQQDFLRARTRI